MREPGRPLSVVVWGNSCAFMRVPPTGPTYGEVLRTGLAAAGIPATLTLRARWFDFLVRAARRYEVDVRPHVPDVLVLHFGMNEAQPWLVPVWFLRHLLERDQVVTRLGRGYRRHVADPAWSATRSFRRKVAPQVGMRSWQTTPDRFAGTLERLLRVVRGEAAPLVLVMDLCPPGAPLRRHFPDIEERHARIDGVLRSAVRAADSPAVQLLDSTSVARAVGVDRALPDGLHFTPEVHHLLGEQLTRQVLSWLDRPGP